MIIERAKLEGVAVLTPKRFGDARGFFCESWNRKVMAEAGFDITWVQDNHSMSERVGTLRGLHFQAPPHAQAKLVRCGRGALFDVIVDIRRGSPTFGQWMGVELSFENGRQLLVPEGYAHGFVTLQPETEIIYKCSDYYAPEADGALLWSSCGVDWPLEGAPILSEKDAAAPALEVFETPFTWRPS